MIMRKNLLLFIATLCATVAVKAGTIILEPGENKISGIINTLAEGDVIELQTGTYTEWSSLEFTTKVTIKAAEGATPTLALYNWQIKNDFEIDGVQIKNVSKDNYLFQVTNDVMGTVAFKNCSMQLNDEVTNYVSYIKLGASVGTLIIDNCIFKDNAKTQEAILGAQSRSINNFSMTNCTAYNCGGVNADLAIFCEHATNVYVDHCTFYNCGRRVVYFTNDVKESYLVQNCVVVNSEVPSTNNYCIAIYAGEVKNCVYNNVNAPRGGDATITSCINVDPQFVNPAEGNFNFAFTSPLFLAATDGSNIGDPRWGVEAEDAIAVPGTLTKDDATLIGPKIEKNDNGIQWKDQDDPTLNSASWTIDVTKAGNYNVIVNVSANSTTTHNFNVSLYDKNGLVKTLDEPNATSGTGAMNCGAFTIATAGKYLVRLMNATQWSSATAENISMTYAGGGIVEIPGTLLPADAILSEKAFIDNDTIIFAPRGAEGHTHEGWAKWNVTLEESTLCSFKANCYRFSGNTMKIKISVIDADNDTIYRKEESVENSGNSEVSLGSALLEAGDYVIQMQNTVQYSKGRLMSVVVEGSPILVITDDSDIDFSDYAGQTVKVQLIRTFKANMYNPICLPFAVSNELFQQIFKSPKSFVLTEASLENQKLFVKLAENYGIYQGTPVMVKPSEDVVNPIFENVEIKTANPSSTTKGPLCLRGSFARHELENKENILLVGANNTLFFPSDEHPYIKSMRAYFELKDVEPSQMPRFAAFVEPGNAPTEMIIVGGEAERQKGHRKVLVDGQIRIQHEGKCYSILGLER